MMLLTKQTLTHNIHTYIHTYNIYYYYGGCSVNYTRLPIATCARGAAKAINGSIATDKCAARTEAEAAKSVHAPAQSERTVLDFGGQNGLKCAGGDSNPCSSRSFFVSISTAHRHSAVVYARLSEDHHRSATEIASRKAAVFAIRRTFQCAREAR